MRGLLAGLERKNGWTLAEHAGEVSPDGTQRLLRTADWDVDGVRDDLRGYILAHLGDDATGVFVVDETGFIKKGVRSAGVQRQYTGTTGKIDNCQLYASSKGRALIDRELYLPTSWTEDPARCAAAGIPAEAGFATKPQLGVAMLARAWQADVLTGWVTADEAYGQNPTFRAWLADHEVPFVLATRNDDVLISPDGHRRQAKVLATLAGYGEGGGWERRSIGAGAHGERIYDWTAVTLDTTGLPDGWAHWLLVRCQTDLPAGKTARELAFYRCAAPARTPLQELIRVAGARWGSRSASRPRRTKPVWTTTKSVRSERGMPTSPWPCSLRPTSPQPAPPNTKQNRKRGISNRPPAADPVVGQRDPPPPRHPRPDPDRLRRARPGLVALAAKTTTPSPRKPLPTTRPTTTTLTT